VGMSVHTFHVSGGANLWECPCTRSVCQVELICGNVRAHVLCVRWS
jgi:hypothetical protein